MHITYWVDKISPLSANFTKLSNRLKQFVGKLLTNCLSVFDQFVGLAFKGLKLSGRLLQDYIMLYFDSQMFVNLSALSVLQIFLGHVEH